MKTPQQLRQLVRDGNAKTLDASISNRPSLHFLYLTNTYSGHESQYPIGFFDIYHEVEHLRWLLEIGEISEKEHKILLGIAKAKGQEMQRSADEHKYMQDHWQKHVAPQQTGGLKSEHIMLASVCIAVLGIASIIIGALA